VVISLSLTPGGVYFWKAQGVSGSEAQPKLHHPSSLLWPGGASYVERVEQATQHPTEQ